MLLDQLSVYDIFHWRQSLKIQEDVKREKSRSVKTDYNIGNNRTDYMLGDNIYSIKLYYLSIYELFLFYVRGNGKHLGSKSRCPSRTEMKLHFHHFSSEAYLKETRCENYVDKGYGYQFSSTDTTNLWHCVLISEWVFIHRYLKVSMS